MFDVQAAGEMDNLQQRQQDSAAYQAAVAARAATGAAAANLRKRCNQCEACLTSQVCLADPCYTWSPLATRAAHKRYRIRCQLAVTSIVLSFWVLLICIAWNQQEHPIGIMAWYSLQQYLAPVTYSIGDMHAALMQLVVH